MKAKSAYVWIAAALLALAMVTSCNKSTGAKDSQVTSEVQTKLRSDNNIPADAITVDAKNGVVTLSGTVADETQRQIAANDASQVDGVRTVVNNLVVGPAAAGEPGAVATQEPTQPERRTTRASRKSTSSSSRRSAQRSWPTGTETASNNTPAASEATSSAPAAPVIEQVTVPDGTQLSIRVNDNISSETAQVGDTFSGVLDSPIQVDGRIAVPAHSDVRGRVVDVASAGKFKGRSVLSLELTELSYNGHAYQINTSRWSRQGSSRGKNTAAKVGGGAALGAIIGAIAGGGKGAAIGGAVGAGAGTGVQAVTKGQQVEVKPETLLTFELQSPVRVVPSSQSNRQRLNPE